MGNKAMSSFSASQASSQRPFDVREDLFNVSKDWKPPTPGRFRKTTDSFRKREQKAARRKVAARKPVASATTTAQTMRTTPASAHRQSPRVCDIGVQATSGLS